MEGLDDLHTNLIDNEDLDGAAELDGDGLPINPEGGDGADGDGDAGKDGADGDGTGADGDGKDGEGSDGADGDDGKDGDGADGDDGTPKDIDTKNLSGMEQYLSKFNIEGGMIDFKDGERTHFDKLDADKQLDVLTRLHESSTKEIEEKFGLDEEEIGLINYMRQEDGTIDEVIDRMAQQRAQTYITAQEVKNANVIDMDADAVYTSFLLKSDPEATPEQLEANLAKAKEMSNFDKVTDRLKKDMVEDQKANVAKQDQDSVNEMHAEIETQRKEVVNVVSDMDSIDGLSINDGIKNDVLDLILDVDDDGDSRFMTEVFSDPEKLFKAAFWYKNGTDIINNREDYWKKEKSAAYKRGQTDAQNGKISFSASDAKDNKKTTPHRSDPDEVVSFDDIHTLS